jgi:hypothetical protein
MWLIWLLTVPKLIISLAAMAWFEAPPEISRSTSSLRSLSGSTNAAQVDVPMYFLVGRRDVNAMASLVGLYYNLLDAPHKELIWHDAEHGADPEEIVDVLVNHVLITTGPDSTR